MDEQVWTPALGLRRAGACLARRAGVALLIWAGLVWLLTPVLNVVVAHWAMWGVIALLLAAPGVAIGYGMGRKLPEIAGMTGVPLLVVASAFVWAVVCFGVILASTLRPLGDWQHAFIIAVTGLWGTLWLIRMTVLES